MLGTAVPIFISETNGRCHPKKIKEREMELLRTGSDIFNDRSVAAANRKPVFIFQSISYFVSRMSKVARSVNSSRRRKFPRSRFVFRAFHQRKNRFVIGEATGKALDLVNIVTGANLT